MGKGIKPGYRRRNQQGYLWLLGLVAVGVITLWGWSEWASPARRIPGLETFPEEGREHVASGTPLIYRTDPPTSGPHYGVATAPGFYAEPQPAGEVVHGLEHGFIAMYYDPADTPAGVVEQLKEYAAMYRGVWDGVVVLPREQPEEVVLTAWRQMLRLERWDKELAEKFIDAFRGRGPENPVR
ncbi:MAG: DUF3105 domain-containing protein [Bacillota bacterium]